MLACLPSGNADVTASPSQCMTQPSGIPSLSPVRFSMSAIPIFHLFNLKDFWEKNEEMESCKILVACYHPCLVSMVFGTVPHLQVDIIKSLYPPYDFALI